MHFFHNVENVEADIVKIIVAVYYFCKTLHRCLTGF